MIESLALLIEVCIMLDCLLDAALYDKSTTALIGGRGLFKQSTS